MSASPGRVSPTASRAGLTLCGAVILLALYGALYPPAPTERSPPKTVAVQFNPGGRDIDPDVPNALYIHRYSEKPTRPLGMAVDPRDNPSAWFADWELASMAASQGAWGICKPPAGIPESCCIGATSRGGSVGWRNWDCTDADNHFKDYPQLGAPGTTPGMRAVIEMLARRGDSLSMTGDSLMYQFAAAAECDWLRSGCTQHTAHHLVQGKDHNKSIDYHYRPGDHLQWNVSCGDLPPVPVQFRLQYRPSAIEVGALLKSTPRGVVLLNFGAHYLRTDGGVARIETELGMLFRLLKQWQERNAAHRTFVWRETFAQHIDADGGEWDSPRRTEGCAMAIEFSDQSPRQWRDIQILEIARRARVVTHVLPGFNHTLGHPRNHPGFGKTGGSKAPITARCEKTHFCHTPLFWAPLFDNLHDIVAATGTL